MIVVVGLSHKSAPIEIRERLALSADDIPAVLGALAAHPSIGEVMVLSTCNRVEVYATTRKPDDADGSQAADAIEQALVEKAGPELASAVQEHLFRYVGDAAIRHVFRVASSLDSLVVGEPQILGQVKDAFELAARSHSIGTMLGRAIETSFRVGKRVRTETQVGAGTVSISSVAVDLAKQIFGDLGKRVVALLGAGEMAEAAARSLASSGARVHVVNRSLQRAQAVATIFKGEARPWTELQRTLIEADVIIASTASPHFVLTAELVSTVSRARRGRSLFIIDIAVPRDVDPKVNEIDGVYLFDIDDLSNIASETMRERTAEAQRAERIVDEEADAFEAWLDSLRVTPTIVALRKQVQAVLEAELTRSLGGKLKHLGAADRKALEGMLSAAVNKLMHAPSTRLKSAAAQGTASGYVEALRELFELSTDEAALSAQSNGGNGETNPNGSHRSRSMPPGSAAPDRGASAADDRAGAPSDRHLAAPISPPSGRPPAA